MPPSFASLLLLRSVDVPDYSHSLKLWNYVPLRFVDVPGYSHSLSLWNYVPQAILGDVHGLLLSDVPPSPASLVLQRLGGLVDFFHLPKPDIELFQTPSFAAPHPADAVALLTVPAVDASVRASELQHGDLQLVLYVQCDHGEVC